MKKKISNMSLRPFRKKWPAGREASDCSTCLREVKDPSSDFCPCKQGVVAR